MLHLVVVAVQISASQEQMMKRLKMGQLFELQEDIKKGIKQNMEEKRVREHDDMNVST